MHSTRTLCLDAVQEEKCTALYGVPTMFIAELGHADFANFDLSTLRTGVMAGSPCPIEVMKQCIEQMNMREVTICYGMTETSPVSTQTLPTDTIEQRTTTVGQVHPHVEIRIADPETGETLPRGTTGEFCARSYSVMSGYWNDAERPHSPSTTMVGCTLVILPSWTLTATRTSLAGSRIW